MSRVCLAQKKYYPEICKQISVVTTCTVQVLGARDEVQRQNRRLMSFKTKHLSHLSPLDSLCIHCFFLSDAFSFALLSSDAVSLLFPCSLSSMITLGLLLLHFGSHTFFFTRRSPSGWTKDALLLLLAGSALMTSVAKHFTIGMPNSLQRF